jgi:RNA polymerase-binding transcription factor DksA
MATKKQAPKAGRFKAEKISKKTTPKKSTRSVDIKASKKQVKSSKSKPVLAKSSKTTTKSAGGKSLPNIKKAAGGKKGLTGKASSKPGKKTEPVSKKPATSQFKKTLTAKQDVGRKTAKPVKKPAVAAKTHDEVKPAIKPLEKPVKKESKPVVIPKTSTTKAVKYQPEFTKSVLDQSQESSVPTMRYSDNELIEFRELINRKLDTAKKELGYLQGLITRKDESGDIEDGRYMTMEDGSMSMEREQLSQMASRQIQFIDHLEKAIMRIENKTYGICRVTGKLIDKARLRAVPHATLSIEAKQTMNR